jgi:hypothetical protein
MCLLYARTAMGQNACVDKDRHNKVVLDDWLSRQRARPQFRSAPTAGLAVSKVIRPLSKKHGGSSSALALERIWPEIMGPRWSKISTPVRFTGGRDGRALVISAPGPAASLILAQSGPILARLNAHLGEGHVRRIKVVQARMTAPSDNRPKRGLTPRQSAKLRDGLSQVEHPGLKQALEKMGRGILRDDD